MPSDSHCSRTCVLACLQLTLPRDPHSARHPRFDAYISFGGAHPQAVFLPPLSACTPVTETRESPGGRGHSRDGGGAGGQAAGLLRESGLVEAPLFYLPPPAGLYFCKVQLQCGDVTSGVVSAIVDLGSTFRWMWVWVWVCQHHR